MNNELLDKLRQMRELANPEKGGKPGEIENAEKMLRRLLDKHGLEMADLDISTGIIHGGIEDTLVDWKQALLFHLSVHHFCKVLVYGKEDGGPPGVAIIVGQPDNVATMQQMYAWWIEQFPLLTEQALEERKNSVVGPFEEYSSFRGYIAGMQKYYQDQDSHEMAWFEPDRWRESYLAGLAFGLGEKLATERRIATPEETAFTESSYVPVVIERPHEAVERETEDYIDENFKTESKDVVAEITPAFYEGREKGRNLPTERQVDGAESSFEIEEKTQE